MSNEPTQNYANHAKTPYPIIITAVLAIIAIALAVGGHFLNFFALNLAATIVLGLAVMQAAYKDRMSDLCVQDRIIRLEMQLRLHRLGLGAEADRLSIKQLVALRFASDEELPALAKKVLAENIEKGSEIKKLVKNWVADHQRV